MQKRRFYTIPMDPEMYHKIRMLAAEKNQTMAGFGRALLIREIVKAEKLISETVKDAKIN